MDKNNNKIAVMWCSHKQNNTQTEIEKKQVRKMATCSWHCFSWLTKNVYSLGARSHTLHSDVTTQSHKEKTDLQQCIILQWHLLKVEFILHSLTASDLDSCLKKKILIQTVCIHQDRNLGWKQFSTPHILLTVFQRVIIVCAAVPKTSSLSIERGYITKWWTPLWKYTWCHYYLSIKLYNQH